MRVVLRDLRGLPDLGLGLGLLHYPFRAPIPFARGVVDDVIFLVFELNAIPP